MIPDGEMDEIRRIARSERLTVVEWARRALRAALTEQGRRDHKLKALREAAKHSFPTADIDQMLE
jgi:hypothetical protein